MSVLSSFGNISRCIRKTNRRYLHRRYGQPLRELTRNLKKEPKYVEASGAFEKLKSNDYVYASAAAATPSLLLSAMAKYGKEKNLENIKVCHMHTEGPALYAQPDYAKNFRSVSFFIGANVRKSIEEGRGTNIPIFLSEIPLLFYKKIIKPDMAVLNLSPPDKHGYCSFGTSIDCVKAGASHSKLIVAMINDKMPRTFGDSVIHISQVDYAVKCSEPLPVHKPIPLDDASKKIGKLIADNLVENEATIQVGIGGIPDAVLQSLMNHKHLGIHSEMFADGVIDLIDKGCVTNSYKSMHTGKTVVSFVNGTQKVYDFVNDNPSVEMLRVDYVNDVNIIQAQHKMVAINSCIEVDLTGQVVSDSIGTRFFSGFGGQVDFIRGAAQSLDGKGKSIISFVSTSKGRSKIAPTIKTGAGVVTTRAHVHYVVTEFGIAELFGKTTRQRMHALINIAHPDHRESLEKAAYERLKVKPSAD